MMTGACSRNVGRLFSELKLVTDNIYTKLSKWTLPYSHKLMALSCAHSTAFQIPKKIIHNCYVHKITYTSTCHTQPALLMHSMASAYRRQIISAMLTRDHIAVINYITHSPCTSTLTTHPALPTPLPSITLLCTKQTNYAFTN